MRIQNIQGIAALILATVLGFALSSPSSAQNWNGSVLSPNDDPTDNPTNDPDNYNYETGELIKFFEQDSTIFSIAANACQSTCKRRPDLCTNPSAKGAVIIRINSLPKRWSNIQCLIDVRQKIDPIDLIQACVAGCTNAKCSNNDDAQSACMALCCDTVYEMKKPSSTASKGRKNDADTFINSCGGSNVPWGICQNYLTMKGRDLDTPSTKIDPPAKAQVKANVMIHAPVQAPNRNGNQPHDTTIKTLMNKSPMNSHPNTMTHPQMKNNTMNEKMHQALPPAHNNMNKQNVRKVPVINNKVTTTHKLPAPVKPKPLPLIKKPQPKEPIKK